MKASEQYEDRSQRDIWNDLVGAAWVRHAAIHDEQAEPFGHAAMDALGDLTGARVLDVGCGTGGTVAQLLDRGAAEVLGVDLSEPMLAAARDWSSGPQQYFEVSDVLDLDRSRTFDVVFSRFGVMFFADPVAAFGQLRALGTPDARLGFCCWGPPFANPVMTLPVMASVAVLGPPEFAGPGEPGPFSLSSPEVVCDVLTAAGWRNIQVSELSMEPPHPAGNASAVTDVVLDFNPVLVEGLRRHPDRRAATHAAIVDALQSLERHGVVHLRASALIVTAQV